MRNARLINDALLVGIGGAWGSQFVLNAWALESFPALTIAAARLAIGAATLVLLTLPPGVLRGAADVVSEDVSSSRAPASPDMPAGRTPIGRFATTGAKPRHPWALYVAIALFEGVLPSVLVPWGQSRLASSVAAILMSTIPLFTLVMSAVVLRGERWRARSVTGVLIGLLGVVVLFGPGLAEGWSGALSGQLAILGAALSFAASLVLIRRLPPLSPVVMMRNVLLIAAAPMVALACIIDRPWSLPVTPAAGASVVGLGVLCGGVVYVMLAALIRRAGATFAAHSNYISVVVGVLLGVLLLGERFGANHVLATLLILVSLALARPLRRSEAERRNW